MFSEFISSFKDPNVAAAVTALATAFAAFASLIAVFVSIYALIIQKRHDRKSVSPLPQIVLGDYENNLHVTIENAGVGPLIIKSFKVTTEHGEVGKSVIGFMPDISLYFYWDNFVEEIEGRTIAPEKSLEILSFSGNSKFGNVVMPGVVNPFESVRSSLGTLTISLEGEDIYGKRLPLCVRKLEWFLREKEGLADKLVQAVAEPNLQASVEDLAGNSDWS